MHAIISAMCFVRCKYDICEYIEFIFTSVYSTLATLCEYLFIYLVFVLSLLGYKATKHNGNLLAFSETGSSLENAESANWFLVPCSAFV